MWMLHVAHVWLTGPTQYGINDKWTSAHVGFIFAGLQAAAPNLYRNDTFVFENHGWKTFEDQGGSWKMCTAKSCPASHLRRPNFLATILPTPVRSVFSRRF